MADHAHARAHDHFDTTEAVARLEAEAQLTDHIDAEVIAELTGLLGSAPKVVVDLGSGPGLATTMLARAFPAADVIAADKSPAMLERVRARAAHEGLSDRIETLRLDLDTASLPPCDVVWASMVAHHTSDPRDLVGRIASALRRGGVACLLEHADAPAVRFADDLGRPGIWDRVQRVRASVGHGGHQGVGELPAMLIASGLDMVADRTVVAVHEDATRPAVCDYAHRQLRGVAARLGDRIAAEDLAVLHKVLGQSPSSSISLRDSLQVSVSRRLLMAIKLAI